MVLTNTLTLKRIIFAFPEEQNLRVLLWKRMLAHEPFAPYSAFQELSKNEPCFSSKIVTRFLPG